MGEKRTSGPVRKWLRRIRDEYELTQEGLAESIGVSRSAVGMYETGSGIPDETMAIIRSKFPIVPPPADVQVMPKVLSAPMFPVSFGKAQMRYAGIVPASSDWGDPLSSEIPIEVDAKFYKARRFVCRVVGNSCEPALYQGDVTIWESDRNPASGKLVIAQRVGDSACTVKVLEYDPIEGHPILCPVNKDCDAPPDGDGWEVIARLVGVERQTEGPEKTWYWPAGLSVRQLTQ